MRTNALDHVALWVADRDTLADFLTDHLGMHVIDKTDKFTLVGSDARKGKLTLFDAEGPRDPGVLERVVLRVSDLDAALAELPDDVAVERRAPDLATFQAPEGLGLGLTSAGAGDGPEYDIDHVVLRVPDPDRTSEELAGYGFERRNGTLAVADKGLRLVAGGSGEGERPLLNHIALLVDSADDLHEDAKRNGLDVADYVDAENTLAVFLWGPDRIKLEYVEHKPGFSLV
ncbi:MAG: VOC family protein [Thermoleophilaceae bacterium]|jgi:catechol 2,3-dioxygenase-like lactoylglutathione lyase family enzyme